MTDNEKWRFPSNQNSTLVGINDAGIETFTANLNQSLVREVIQNSLDAAVDDTKPVLVEFSRFDIPQNEFPDLDNFRNAIIKCRKSNDDDPNAVRFFKNAEQILDRKSISVLRISDYNTRGLEGSDTCAKGTSWSRLVKESGSSNKGQGSGGSFGIGKSAAFACSDLRTVFYSSMDIRNLKSDFGVAKLVSFKDDNDEWTTGTRFYSENTKFVAIRGKLASFDHNYTRDSPGTDIYVMGMHEKDFKAEFIKAVLMEFLVSINSGKLVVKIQDDVIDSDKISKYIYDLQESDSKNKEISALANYYDLITSSKSTVKKIKLDSNEYGKEFGFKDGECTLYLKEGNGLNRKILITRKAGMRILEKNRISGSIEFTGVMIMEGDNMNEAFKRMEVPSHDAFEPGRVRGEESKYRKILTEFYKYLKHNVNELFGKVTTNIVDAYGASDFLPDETSDTSNGENMKENALSTGIKNIEVKKTRPVHNKSIPIDVDEKKGSSNSEDISRKKSESEDDNGNNGEPEEKTSSQGSRKSDTGHNFTKAKASQRLICKDVINGEYILNMLVPVSSAIGKLEFNLSGEQTDYRLPLSEVNIVKGDAKIKSFCDNNLYLSNLKKGQKLTIEFQISFKGYCMMEVDYYYAL